ncbi:hypothetical protein [Enhygromyxa salina]|uniref:IcmF-related N-terminal domain-containing protein n=1 Tax=Enhygromyxa salina TaxID=215803 RepID=A0A2S9YUF9_9BACT|nr:hypothetical protein [Enhygromyxa salina]PRQ08679.1 hypothetical protein ENSA7_16240 [Enhygromyxa salina]
MLSAPAWLLAEEASPWWAEIPWTTVLIVLVVVLVLALLVWGVIAWRRKRATIVDAGPSVGSQLRELWQPFYQRLPTRAQHYPTVVVLGEAGVGKTHAISTHVDWRGQTNQFQQSVDHGAAMQLYLGPDVVIHELSAAILRDVSRAGKRALEALWRNMGPSATVVLTLDARTLLATPPAALRELAQLVRGKISLFPERCRESLEVRLYLSHLDQLEGYEDFASVLGSDHGPLDLGALGDGTTDAAKFVAGFDAHLAYALTSRTGDEFDRTLGFYGVLPSLIDGLRPVLDTLAGKHEPFAVSYPASGLYLGSLLPHSCVGRPFEVARALIAQSIGRARRRGLAGSIAMTTGILAIVFALMAWHSRSIRAAEDHIVAFIEILDGCPTPNTDETRAAERVTALVEAIDDSEILWFEYAFQDRKLEVDQHFEEAIRIAYLEPQLADPSRVKLIYVTSLIYAVKDDDLGELISENVGMWADELGLNEWVIEYYLDRSHERFGEAVTLPDTIENTGAEWSRYIKQVDRVVRQGTMSRDDAAVLRRDLPELLGPRQYTVLVQARELLAADPDLSDRLQPLLTGELDSWTATQHQALAALLEKIQGLDISPGDTSSWGLDRLVIELERTVPDDPHDDYVLEVDGVTLSGKQLAAVILRSQRHERIDAVRSRIWDQRPEGGREFFAANARPPAAGVINGYGGGPTESISGFYTRAAFERHVAPVLRFAGERLSSASRVVEPAPEPELEPALEEAATVDAAGIADAASTQAEKLDITRDDAQGLERAIWQASEAYAAAYRAELLDYYQSFELDSASEMTLPFVFRAFVKPSSWFTEFLLAVSRNASLELPEDNEFFMPMARALEDFAAFKALMLEDGGALPGLEPYQALLAELQPVLTTAAGPGGQGSGQGAELSMRLSALGALTLSAMQGTATDYDAQVELWLLDMNLDRRWHAPFRAPVEQTRALGIQNIEWELQIAWTQEVRPIVRPLLHSYPFNPRSGVDVDVDELEQITLSQGKQRGAFWLAFDRLIAPAMTVDDGQFDMYDDVKAPHGMLVLVRDLARMSSTLWDQDGARVPLKVVITAHALPKEPYQGRVAAMSYLRSGGAAVYGFNQRPEPQTMALQWWNQGGSVISLEMKSAVGDDARSFAIEEDGGFSFYRLLDAGRDIKSSDQRATITETAINAATRCFPGEPSATVGLDVRWEVPLSGAGVASRTVRMTLVNDPWRAFAVRDCS